MRGLPSLAYVLSPRLLDVGRRGEDGEEEAEQERASIVHTY